MTLSQSILVLDRKTQSVSCIRIVPILSEISNIIRQPLSENLIDFIYDKTDVQAYDNLYLLELFLDGLRRATLGHQHVLNICLSGHVDGVYLVALRAIAFDTERMVNLGRSQLGPLSESDLYLDRHRLIPKPTQKIWLLVGVNPHLISLVLLIDIIDRVADALNDSIGQLLFVVIKKGEHDPTMVGAGAHHHVVVLFMSSHAFV